MIFNINIDFIINIFGGRSCKGMRVVKMAEYVTPHIKQTVDQQLQLLQAQQKNRDGPPDPLVVSAARVCTARDTGGRGQAPVD